MRISDWSSDVCSSDLRVLPSARGELVEIHDDGVDPDAGDVNKTVELTFLILRQAGMTTTLPSTMTAIDPEGPGGPEVLVPVARPVPAPGPGEVLIRVHAAGVNRPDVLQRKGGYAPPHGVTTILGLEVGGEIVAVGEGDRKSTRRNSSH